jgi:hypothetical protein
MIFKRYQYISSNGIEWTDWAPYMDDDSKLEYLQKEEAWQLKPKLKNQYKIV